jgi:hypothetical protein
MKISKFIYYETKSSLADGIAVPVVILAIVGIPIMFCFK